MNTNAKKLIIFVIHHNSFDEILYYWKLSRYEKAQKGSKLTYVWKH